MIAVQTLEKRTAELKQKDAQLAVLKSEVEELKAKQATFEALLARPLRAQKPEFRVHWSLVHILRIGLSPFHEHGHSFVA
jgi:hypothetical protein